MSIGRFLAIGAIAIGAIAIGVMLTAVGIDMLAERRLELGGFLILGGLLIVVAGYEAHHTRRSRPELVCRRCFSLAQPKQRSRGVQACAVCGSKELLSPESPMAKQILEQAEADRATAQG